MSDPPSSKMMENKYTIIHIACEIVVVLGLVFYFNSKNKKVLGYIEELVSKIDELEELSLGLEKAIKTQDTHILNLTKQLQEVQAAIIKLQQGEIITPVASTPTVETSEIVPSVKKNNLRKKLGVNSIPRKPKEVPVQVPEEIVSEQQDEEEDEEELDRELSDELEELAESNEDMEELDITNEEDLKKTP